jgi:hypothetical protein
MSLKSSKNFRDLYLFDNTGWKVLFITNPTPTYSMRIQIIDPCLISKKLPFSNHILSKSCAFSQIPTSRSHSWEMKLA